MTEINDTTENSEPKEGSHSADSAAEAELSEQAGLVATELGLIRIARPTKFARRLDKLRRVTDSTFAGIGVAAGVVALTIAPVPGLVPLFVAGAYIGTTFVASARMRSFLRPLRAAFAGIERGDFSSAAQLCKAQVETAKWPVSHFSVLMLAYFARRRGRFHEAIELNKLVAQDDDGLFRDAIATELAVCQALLGETTAARTSLPAKKRWRHRSMSASFAIVWTRIGNTRNVSKLRLKSTRKNLEFIRHELRLLCVFKAFTVFERSPDYLSIRPLLMEAGPAFLTEFDYLGVHWPAMKEFVDTYVSPKDVPKDEQGPQNTGW